jgi:hypothetical protein
MAAWRYIAQRALTREILDVDLPLRRDELTWALSGPGSFKGSLDAALGTHVAPDGRPLIEPWSTAIYVEADGEIRAGLLVTSTSVEGSRLVVEAAGFTTYPHGLPYTGPDYVKIQIDPAQVVKDLWAHIQAQPSGDLGVVVTGSTPVRIGTEERDVSFETAEGETVEFTAGPYKVLWADAPDQGSEIDSLAKETPFDYVESHRWDGDAIAHEVAIRYPRAGARRTDLAFRDGENITSSVPVVADGSAFANHVLGIGAGTGKAAVQAPVHEPDGRLRRVAVYTDKSVTSTSRMTSLARAELARRQKTFEISSIDVRDHPNAPIGSWALGDDVLVEVDVPFYGPVSLWCRVVAWTLLGETTARLSLVRSDSFTYGA